ncbi:MAG: hypothetical protein ACK4UT_02010 [Moraxellaceae bacterium]
MSERLTRASVVGRLRDKLLRQGWPRLQMSVIVAITGAAGLLASWTLLQLGMQAMQWRYPLAVGAAWLVYLLLLWLWLRTRAEDYMQSVDVQGGECQPAAPCDAAGSEADALDGLSFADDAAIPFLAVVLGAGVLFSLLWVLYTAPLLFAELILDGALAAGYYRRLRRAERRHWLSTAVRFSWKPFLCTAVMLGIAGALLAHHAPGAVSLGAALGALW